MACPSYDVLQKFHQTFQSPYLIDYAALKSNIILYSLADNVSFI